MKLRLEDFFPQGEPVQDLADQIRSGRLPHALLITGEEGVGKKTLASLISAGVLCRDPHPPCCRCEDCRQVMEGDHPDMITLIPGIPLSKDTKPTKNTIPVQDIRDMITRIGIHSMSGGSRAVIIRDADRMTDNAQNALLKSLEEPPEGTYFILVCTQDRQLLPTVISRCRQIRLHPWDDGYILKVLQEAGAEKDRLNEIVRSSGGSVGKALDLLQDEHYWEIRKETEQAFLSIQERSDIYQLSSAWKDRKDDAMLALSILQGWIEQMMQHRMNPQKNPMPAEMKDGWARMSESCRPEDLIRLEEGVDLAGRQLQSSVNVPAVMERLIFLFMEERTRW